MEQVLHDPELSPSWCPSVRSDRSLCAPLAGEADAHKPQASLSVPGKDSKE